MWRLSLNMRSLILVILSNCIPHVSKPSKTFYALGKVVKLCNTYNFGITKWPSIICIFPSTRYLLKLSKQWGCKLHGLVGKEVGKQNGWPIWLHLWQVTMKCWIKLAAHGLAIWHHFMSNFNHKVHNLTRT